MPIFLHLSHFEIVGIQAKEMGIYENKSNSSWHRGTPTIEMLFVRQGRRLDRERFRE